MFNIFIYFLIDMDTMQQIIFDDDDADDHVWQTTVHTMEIMSEYYLRYNYKQPCMDSQQTGIIWLLELIRGNEKRCLNMFRMDKHILINLCRDLERNYGLTPSRRMTVLEKVGMFLYVLSLGASNRQVQERFQHSGETVSRNFHEVLKTMMRFSIDLIKPKDPTFSTIPSEILNDERYMPHLKVLKFLFYY